MMPSMADIVATMPVVGTIVDMIDSPVSNHHIVLDGGNYRSLSSIDGSFSFLDIPSGWFKILMAFKRVLFLTTPVVCMQEYFLWMFIPTDSTFRRIKSKL